MTRTWIADFDWEPGAVTVKKTGARVRIDGETLSDVFAWFTFYTAIQLRRMRPRNKRQITMAFSPDPIRPWYLAWAAATEAGVRLVNEPDEADIVFHFDDSTLSAAAEPKTKPNALLLNFRCADVSKSRVATAFEAAFGYSLALDPRTHTGPAVEKSEQNGAHDGRVVYCPVEPLPGRVYQRLIDNRYGENLVQDLRTPTVGGRPACVFLKRRNVDQRFTNSNTEVSLVTAESQFSATELAKIAQFTEKLGLDWGGLDVLRDSQDGRIYVVDANKTDMGPPLALPLKEKLRATRLLASALDTHIQRTARSA